MNPARRRRKRREPAIERYLDEWKQTVRRKERDLKSRRVIVVCTCSSCSPPKERHPRDALEFVIRRGGKTGRRVAKQVAPWDARFRAVTEPAAKARAIDGLWWNARVTPGTVEACAL